MSTTLQSLTGLGNTDGLFQTFCTALDTNILGFGWLATSDTGQINPATVTHPAANADAGYLVYKTNDGLTTVYLKIIVGLDGGNRPRLTINVGTGTDGAGTLTGNTGTATVLRGNVPDPTQLAMSGSSGRLTIVYGTLTGGSDVGYGLSIGRTVDTVGAPNDNGVEVFIRTFDVIYQQFIPKVGNGVVPAQETGWRAIFTRATSGILGTHIRYGHPCTWGETINNNPTLCVMLWGRSDFAPGAATTKSLTLYGTTHTFLLDGDDAGGVIWSGAGNSSRCAWRYE